MKITVVIDTWFPFAGGGQVNTWEVSRLIALRGNKVTILTRNNGNTPKLRAKNLQVLRLGARSKVNNSLSKGIFTLRATLFLLRSKQDIIHAHAFLPGISAFFVKLIKGTACVFTVHGTSLNTKMLNPIMRGIEMLILTIIPYDAQITVSRDFLRLKNVNKNVIFIPNATKVTQYVLGPNKKSITHKLLFVGKLHSQKNVINLVKSLAIVRNEIPDIKLHIAGDGELKSEIIKLVRQLRLRRNVEILGLLDQKSLAQVYTSCTFFIQPSVYEGQSIALLDSMAFGLVPIVSAVGDNPYLLKDNKNAFFIESPCDELAISKSIKRAFGSKNLDIISNKAYNLVKNDFNWESVAVKTLDLYEKIAKSKN